MGAQHKSALRLNKAALFISLYQDVLQWYLAHKKPTPHRTLQ